MVILEHVYVHLLMDNAETIILFPNYIQSCKYSFELQKQKQRESKYQSLQSRKFLYFASSKYTFLI